MFEQIVMAIIIVVFAFLLICQDVKKDKELNDIIVGRKIKDDITRAAKTVYNSRPGNKIRPEHEAMRGIIPDVIERKVNELFEIMKQKHISDDLLRSYPRSKGLYLNIIPSESMKGAKYGIMKGNIIYVSQEIFSLMSDEDIFETIIKQLQVVVYNEADIEQSKTFTFEDFDIKLLEKKLDG